MGTFRASVQYGDWHGTSAADDSDQRTLEEYLKERKLVKEDEVLIAASVHVENSHPEKLGYVFVRAFLFSGPQNVDELADALNLIGDSIPVRAVDLELTLADFVCLFKRFHVMLTWQRLPLESRSYDVADE